MATRFYLHNALSGISGTLPTGEQSSKTAFFNFDTTTNNRSMSTSIGTAQASLTHVNTTQSQANNTCYVTRFVSTAINQTSIAANTWTYNFAVKLSVTTNTDDYPTNDTAPKFIPICCYVWRPSTGVKVGNILDGNSATGVYTDIGNLGTPTTSESVEHGTFTGSAVASTAAGDVIILEAWVDAWLNNTTSVTFSYFYDGTTVNTTAGAIVSNHASFLETPENITLQSANQNITKSLTETVTVGATTPTRLKGSKRTATETITISSTPATLAAKKRALTETVAISTDPGSPSFIKAHNVNKALTETVTIGATTPTRIKGAVKPLTSTVTINTPAPTYIQHPNRIRKTITENVSINSTVVKKSSKTRTLLN